MRELNMQNANARLGRRTDRPALYAAPSLMSRRGQGMRSRLLRIWRECAVGSFCAGGRECCAMWRRVARGGGGFRGVTEGTEGRRGTLRTHEATKQADSGRSFSDLLLLAASRRGSTEGG